MRGFNTPKTMRLTSLCFVVFFAGLAVARADRQIIPPERIHYIKSPDYTVQLMGGMRWDFEVKTDNTRALIVDFGFGTPNRHWASHGSVFGPHFVIKPVTVVTIVVIPDGEFFRGKPVKYKVIITVNDGPDGRPYGNPYFDTYTDPKVYGTKQNGPSVGEDGIYRLMSAWDSGKPPVGKPAQSILLGFFEGNKDP